jgi:hypothetical protein
MKCRNNLATPQPMTKRGPARSMFWRSSDQRLEPPDSHNPGCESRISAPAPRQPVMTFDLGLRRQPSSTVPGALCPSEVYSLTDQSSPNVVTTQHDGNAWDTVPAYAFRCGRGRQIFLATQRRLIVRKGRTIALYITSRRISRPSLPPRPPILQILHRSCDPFWCKEQLYSASQKPRRSP